MTEDTFFSPVYVDGRRLRWEGDVDWIIGPASLRAEYTRVTDDRLGQGLSEEDLPDARYRSWYLSGTYLLTGETKTRPVVPRTAFLQGGAGAMELAGRYERIRYDSAGGKDEPFRNPRAETILPSGESVVTLGVNWVLNRWITVQLNVIREHIDDPERSPVTDGAAFWSRILRFQFAL
jgi:phosphate-selective porin